MPEQKIDWCSFSLWGKEKDYINDALDSTWISGGEYITRFEQRLKDELELPNAFAVANGTAAIQLAYLTLGIAPGDEVLVPAFGFLAAANVLKLMHAVPVFVDVDPKSWCMDVRKIQESVTSKTKAILVIHNYGVVADMAAVRNIADRNNLFLIEDCAESIFSRNNHQYCGTLADISTFSFHATKTIATGEGGMVSCRSAVHTDRLKLIRSHGLKRETRQYWHEYYGNNFRMSNLLAAVGLAQLEMREQIVQAKKRVLNRYLANLQDCRGLRFQFVPNNSQPVIWAIGVQLVSAAVPCTRDEIMRKLAAAGIECRPGFYTPNQLDLYKAEVGETHPVANHIAETVIVLPSSPTIRDDQIDYVCTQLKLIIT
ncbi:MAG: GDP-perosamine synthase [Nitrosomonadaceae bacterium]|nr:GDP-perosamine synthase [Nitrosomonadaceae bacterium]